MPHIVFSFFSNATCADDWQKSQVYVPEGVSYAVTEVKKVPVIMEQEVSGVEIDITSFENIPEQLLLRQDVVPCIA